MRVAILVSGHLRTWEFCKDNFFKTFPHNMFDIFFECYDTQYGYHPYIQGKINYFDDKNVNNILGNELSKSWNITKDEIDFDKLNINHHMKEFNHGYKQYSKLQKCIDQMVNYEELHDIKYDYVIKTRFDLIYKDNLIYNIRPLLDAFVMNKTTNTFILDSNNTFPNDHIIIGKRDDIINLPKFILNEYTTPSNMLSWSNPPHGLLENYIITNNIKTMVVDIVEIVRKT